MSNDDGDAFLATTVITVRDDSQENNPLSNNIKISIERYKKYDERFINICQKGDVLFISNGVITINNLYIYSSAQMDENQNLNVTYWFYAGSAKEILGLFDDSRSTINDCFKNNGLPKLVVYDYLKSAYYLTFTTNRQNLPVPIKDAFFRKKLKELGAYPTERKALETYLRYKKKKILPPWKKKKFGIGEEIYNKTEIINNNDGKAIKSYKKIPDSLNR